MPTGTKESLFQIKAVTESDWPSGDECTLNLYQSLTNISL